MPQVGHLLRARRARGLQVQQKSEAVKVPLDIIVAWVPFIKPQLGEELRLRRRLQSDGKGGDPDLRTLGVKIAAETLKMGAEVQHETSQRLVEERGVRREEGPDGGAVRLHCVQSQRAVILPVHQGCGRHGTTSTKKGFITGIYCYGSVRASMEK
jgi:hypothetical protein